MRQRYHLRYIHEYYCLRIYLLCMWEFEVSNWSYIFLCFSTPESILVPSYDYQPSFVVWAFGLAVCGDNGVELVIEMGWRKCSELLKEDIHWSE